MIPKILGWAVVIGLVLFAWHHPEQSGAFVTHAVTQVSAFFASL